MLKSEELRSPASCLNKAASDELVFVLRAKDPLAPQAIRLWAAMAEGRHEPDKIREAIDCAARMDKWRQEREPKCEPAPSMPAGWDTPRAARASAGY